MSYIRLTKPRSVLLLLICAFAGMVMAGRELPLAVVVWTVIGGAFAAGGANVLNSYLDRDLDRLMARTASRPLPSGVLGAREAMVFGLLLCIAAMAVLVLGVNWLAAALSAFGVFYYVVIYTLWLKRASWWNVVIGGGAGAMPLLVGWSAATGQLSPWALWLGALVVLWTPAHFWSLALVRRREYAFAGVPMLPVVRGEEDTRRQILVWAVMLLGATVVLTPVGITGTPYLAVALPLGAWLLFLSVRLVRLASEKAALELYRYSIVYLAMLFAAMILDRVIET